MKKILFSLFLILILTFLYGCEEEDKNKNLTIYEDYELIKMATSTFSYKAVILKEDEAIELKFYQEIKESHLTEGKVYDFYVDEDNVIRGYKEVEGD